MSSEQNERRDEKCVVTHCLVNSLIWQILKAPFIKITCLVESHSSFGVVFTWICTTLILRMNRQTRFQQTDCEKASNVMFYTCFLFSCASLLFVIDRISRYNVRVTVFFFLCERVFFQAHSQLAYMSRHSMRLACSELK